MADFHSFSKNRITKKKRTLLASYPRSGNSLVRTLLEKITSTVTGSDTRPDRTLSRALSLMFDLTGEGYTNASIVKSHWPERRGCKMFEAHKVILLVRNPFDAIDSYFNMMLTNTHTESLTKEVYDKYYDFFIELCRSEIQIWAQFIDFYKDLAEQKGLPILIVKYEDLLDDTEQQCIQMLKFVLETNEIQNNLNAYWSSRIKHCVGERKISNLGSYQPRGKTKEGKSLHKYRPTLLNELLQSPAAHSYLCQFGYYEHSCSTNYATIELNNIKNQSCPLFMGSLDSNASFLVNSGKEIRPPSSFFGRYLTTWRRTQTNNDENPFPTVSKTSPSVVGIPTRP